MKDYVRKGRGPFLSLPSWLSPVIRIPFLNMFPIVRCLDILNDQVLW